MSIEADFYEVEIYVSFQKVSLQKWPQECRQGASRRGFLMSLWRKVENRFFFLQI